jgi:branched-chain amino acid transport system substrate-binding protein
VELLVEDDAGKPAEAVRIMKKHVLQDNADFIIGGCSSAEAIPMVPVAGELETLFMVTVAEAPEITAELCNKYTFRLTPDARQKAKAMAPFMVKELGVKKWQMLYWDMAWGEGLRDEFRRELEGLGGSLPVAIPVPPGTTDFAQYLTKLKPPQEVPGVFHAVASTDAIRLDKAIGEFGLQKKYTLVGTCCAMFSEVFQELNPSVDGIYLIDQYPDLPIPPLDSEWDMKFRAEFLEVSKGIPAESHSWSSMESLFVLKKAIEQAGGYKDKKKDTLKVIKAIEGQKGEKGPNFPQGPYYIRPEDHSGLLNLYIFQIKDGKEIMKKVVPYQESMFPPSGKCKM